MCHGRAVGTLDSLGYHTILNRAVWKIVLSALDAKKAQPIFKGLCLFTGPRYSVGEEPAFGRYAFLDFE